MGMYFNDYSGHHSFFIELGTDPFTIEGSYDKTNTYIDVAT